MTHISGQLFLQFGAIPRVSTFTSGPAVAPPGLSGIAQAVILARGGGGMGGAPPISQTAAGWLVGGVTQKAAGSSLSIAQAGAVGGPGGPPLARKCPSPASGTWRGAGSGGLVANPREILRIRP